VKDIKQQTLIQDTFAGLHISVNQLQQSTSCMCTIWSGAQNCQSHR